MATTIKIKNSVTATNAPSSLVQGEVAINVTDKKVWVGNAATTPIQLLGGGADGSFTNISVSSVATFGAGTVSAPSITTTGDTNTGIYFPAADTIAFTEGGVEAMRIDSSGNVGIGTSTPSSFGKLVVKTSSTSEAAGLAVMSSANDSFLTIYNSGSVHNIGATYSSTGSYQPIAFVTSGSERMRITSDGIVRINNTSDATFSAQLNTQFTTSKNCGIYLKVTDTNSSQSMILFGNTTSDAVGGISTSGSATSYATSSDYRLKENIAQMTGALATVSQLKPCTYTWKVDGSAGQGFIAHELQAVVPDCVTGEKDAVETYTDEDGNEQTRIKPQGIDTSFLVATLTAAIQELKAELDSVKAELQTLKGN